MQEEKKLEDLQEYRVRLPKDIVEKLPKAKIVARKSIQLMVREAIEAHFKRLNL
jgi:predicted DNA-binding protein